MLQASRLRNPIESVVAGQLLAPAIRNLGGLERIVGGRQASDWDNAQVPLGLAEIVGMASITLARKVEVKEGKVVVERLIPDGYEVVEALLPAIVTVSNELCQPRYPTLRGIMAATRKRPTIWTAGDLEIESGQLEPRITLHDLFVPVRNQTCEIIEGDDEADSARLLALKLREDKLIETPESSRNPAH